MLSSDEYVTLRSRRRDQNGSPARRPVTEYQTPPKFSVRPSKHQSPMLNTSPLKQRSMPVDSMDEDDVFSSPMQPYRLVVDKDTSPVRPPASSFDTDDDDALFLAPHSPSNTRSLFPPSSSPMPLRTPVKQTSNVFETPSRPVFSAAPTNSPFTVVPATANSTKRTPTPVMFSTPDRRCLLTPLRVTSSASDLNDGEPFGFERLAPLPAPSFATTTPVAKTDSDAHLKRQSDSMRRLKIQDRDRSGDESGYDSTAGTKRERESGKKQPTAPPSTVKPKTKKSPGLALLIGKGNEDEVIEAMSPGGHVNKRRARQRHMSAELLAATPAPRSNENKGFPTPILDAGRAPETIAFPSLSSLRSRCNSASSTSSIEPGSPKLRTRRPSSSAARTRLPPKHTPLDRLSSISSASLFFGPSIPQPETRQKKGSDAMSIDAPPGLGGKPRARHSFAGNSSPSRDDMDEEELFFSSPGRPSSLFAFAEEHGSPTKRTRTSSLEKLQKKFRPRDSGIVVDDSEDEFQSSSLSTSGGLLLTMPGPRASGSLSSIQSESDGEALVTPGIAPGPGSGWPGVGIVNDDSFEYDASDANDGADAFILRMLAAGPKSTEPIPGEPQRVPGTPVKKVKTSHLVERPWQSAVANRIGFPEFNDPYDSSGGKDGKGKPRKSLPAAFPGLMTTRQRKDAFSLVDTDEETSPTTRKDGKHLGVGRPPVPQLPKTVDPKSRARWLMRRSSSGAFSSGSDTSRNATPTRLPAKDWQLPAVAQHSPLSKTAEAPLPCSQESTSSAVSETSTATNSPTVDAVARHFPTLPDQSPQRPLSHTVPRPPRPTVFPGSAIRGRLSIPSSEERPGKFEREFAEIDELGRGEFGRVMKARYKESSSVMFAVKKSKRFEGVKHRQRLREEVDILKHLSRAACSAGYGDRHPNVLSYIDSWEEEETLYIQTELCALGNFAHFLWEYGRHFPKLDESRVWKIFSELSSGLDFIHNAGAIHLDLKPANIFITDEGRLKIGDFGMASVWPRPVRKDSSTKRESFEREGDKLYLAPEVLQGRYGKAADIFSIGMTMLETATNIVVPDQGDAWHRIRHDDFSQIDFASISTELIELLKGMMRSDPDLRVDAGMVCSHPVIVRARLSMDELRKELGPVFHASALAGASEGWLEDILGHNPLWGGEEDDEAMDLGV
ncbi:uncharacterized protein PHACADRAFT_122634 [Phanerochaete carnosa HHB-10118-sp]|uniref:Protein kinase domain-containing protein n=1 Tax=Phanerochaete carnosa (strain HHB-10118-sp) TaxID=650164 RepID=K5W499_PHACS|nr:uncharacterized protein PHACADRAFT_122634 [Phanerochaete carnosa HHB-10118-sp]EKM53975.1 hypothetical protein PHACADRAFT_122634 [Phanerochaete carnosa HHB-10118-sp]